MEIRENDKIMSEFAELKKLVLLGCKNVLNVSDLSILTGLSPSFIYKKVMNREIPFYKSPGGKLTYFDKSEIENWMLHCRVATNDELTSEAATYCATSNKSKK